jgi:replicative DNA helicase
MTMTDEPQHENPPWDEHEEPPADDDGARDLTDEELDEFEEELQAIVRSGGTRAATPSPAAEMGDRNGRLVPGGSFILDAPPGVPARWGRGDDVLWAQGESLIITGPPGVGKTTLLAQAVFASIGIGSDAVLDLPVAPVARVLYLAMDRPAQIQRAFRRMVTEADRGLLDEHLVVWKGPPERDLARNPTALLELVQHAAADIVILDSLKDATVGLTDDDIGAGINSAMQHVLADGRDVGVIHHQRKSNQGSKPTSLEDLYGSIFIAAGAGSVVLLWGAAGDPLVELTHLKQPAAAVGPLTVEHNHAHGTSTVFRAAADPLEMLRHAAGGLTITEIARVVHSVTNPTDTQKKNVQRKLEKLMNAALVHHEPQKRGGSGGSQPGRYFAAITADRATDTARTDTAADSSGQEAPELF